MENTFILQIVAVTYMAWSTSTNKKKYDGFQDLQRYKKKLNAVIEKKSQKNMKKQKRRNTEKELQHFQEI